MAAGISEREELSLIIDDVEKLRCQARAGIQKALPLLADAQHALAHGSLDVVAEYLERAYDHLSSALDASRYIPPPS